VEFSFSSANKSKTHYKKTKSKMFKQSRTLFAAAEAATELFTKRVVLLGAPGVGKGTYASRASKILQVPHFAAGKCV